MRFRTRLTLFLIVLLAGVQLLTIAVAYSYARHAMVESGRHELELANQMFRRNLDLIAERVTTGVQVLALDFGLRTAIAENDRLTALSVLKNHGRRISARRMMYISLDGDIEADTAFPNDDPHAFPFDALIDEAWQHDTATALTTIDGETHWTIVVPVMAPEVIGFVAAFVAVDDPLLNEMRRLSSAPVSIALISRSGDDAWSIIASSSGRGGVMSVPAGFDPFTDDETNARRNHQEFLYSAGQLPTAENSAPVFVLHEFRLSDVLASNWALFGPLFLVLAAGLLVAAAGAFLLARGMSSPLEVLAAAARRIRTGDYDVDVSAGKGSRETLQLGSALAETAQAIRDREAELKESNRSLEIARDEARDADRAKSQFIANMSHELRTPLNSIIGFADVIRKQHLGPVGSEDYLQYAEFIASGGRGLLDLHNSILDIARLEAGKYDLRPDQIDLRELVVGLHDEMASMAEARKVEFKISCGDQPASVDGDYAALMKAARNLVHNAIKFTPEGGAVTISLKLDGDHARIIVRDNGIGMAQDEAARMMRPFQRGHVDYNADYPGAGLGLSVTDGVVALHLGRLSLISAPMEGTTATIQLPLRKSQSGREAA